MMATGRGRPLDLGVLEVVDSAPLRSGLRPLVGLSNRRPKRELRCVLLVALFARTHPLTGEQGKAKARPQSAATEPVLNEIATTKATLEQAIERWMELEA